MAKMLPLKLWKISLPGEKPLHMLKSIASLSENCGPVVLVQKCWQRLWKAAFIAVLRTKAEYYNCFQMAKLVVVKASWNYVCNVSKGNGICNELWIFHRHIWPGEPQPKHIAVISLMYWYAYIFYVGRIFWWLCLDWVKGHLEWMIQMVTLSILGAYRSCWSAK